MALAIALGAGYWKYSNPDAGVAELRTQASGSLGAVSSIFSGRNNDEQLNEALARSDDLQAELYETRSVLDQNIAELADTRALLGEQQQALQDQKALTDGYNAKFIELENSLSALGDKAQADQQALNASQNSLASLEGQVTQLAGQLNAEGASRQQTVDKKIAELDGQIQSLAAEATQNKAQFGTELENLNATLSSQNEALASQHERAIATASNELQADYEQRLETLASALTSDQDEKLTATTIALREERQLAIDNSERNLQQNFNGLQNQFTTLSAITGDASSALELTSTLDERLASLEDSLAEIDSNPAIARLKRDIKSEQDQLGELVEERLAGLESLRQEDQTTLENRVASLDTSINDQLNDRISTLQTTLQESNSGESDRITQQLDLARKKIAVLESKTADLDAKTIAGRIDSLELAAAKPADNEAQELDNKLAALENSMQDLNSEVSEINTRLSTLSDAEAERQSIAASQTEIQERLASLDQSVDSGNSVDSDLQNVLAELTQSRSRIEQLEARVAGLPESSEQSAEAQENQKQLISKLDLVRKKVSELEQRRYVTPEDLAKGEKDKAKAVEYKIYFDIDSATISKDAQKVLSSFIAQEKNRANSISIFGFTDRSGNAAYNQRLALRRANRVRSFLIQQGFDFRKINAVDGLGEDLAASKDGDGNKDANQRTVVLYAYQD